MGLKKSMMWVFCGVALMAVAVPCLAGDQTSSWHPRTFGPEAERGRAFFKQQSCLNCHSIRGEGGCLAPVLDGIGAHRSEAFIVGRISTNESDRKRFSAEFNQTELMEHVRVKPEQAHAIASYLLTIPSPKSITATGHSGVDDDKDARPAGSAFVPALPDESSKAGAALYNKHHCSTCHSIGDIGGRLAPQLDGIGARRSRNFIQGRMRSGAMSIVENPTEGKSSRISMPPQMLTKKEVTQITDYLMTLPVKKKQ